MGSIVGGNPPTTEQTSSSTGSSPPSQSVLPSSTSSSPPSHSVSPSSTRSSPPSQSISPGAIAGTVVGVVALLSLLAAFFWHRRQKTQKSQATTRTSFVDPIPRAIEPKHALLDASSCPTSTAAVSLVAQRQKRSLTQKKNGLPFLSPNEDLGRNSWRRWKSPLFGLASNHVVRAESKRQPPMELPSEEEAGNPTSALTGYAGASPPSLALNTYSYTQLAGSRRGRDNGAILETMSPPISGPEPHIEESTVPPFIVPSLPPPVSVAPEASTSSPSPSPNVRHVPVKASFQGMHSSTTLSLPTATISPPSPSGGNTALLLRELAGLCDQILHLTSLHSGGGGLDAVGEAEPHDPPPDYVGRGYGG